MRQKPVPSLSVAVVRTAVSNGMRREREALAGLRRQINPQHVSDTGRLLWQAFIKAAAAADAARGAGRIQPAGKDFIVVIFATMCTFFDSIVAQCLWHYIQYTNI